MNRLLELTHNRKNWRSIIKTRCAVLTACDVVVVVVVGVVVVVVVVIVVAVLVVVVVVVRVGMLAFS